eukprot:2561494-Amphidinium_carterae.1
MATEKNRQPIPYKRRKKKEFREHRHTPKYWKTEIEKGSRPNKHNQRRTRPTTQQTQQAPKKIQKNVKWVKQMGQKIGFFAG